MNLFYSMAQAAKKLSRPVVAIGNFDGVHTGHRHIFSAATELANKLETGWAVVTFDPHPAKFLAPEFAPQLITTFESRLKLIDESGPDGIIVLDFDKELVEISPEGFVRDYLAGLLRVSGVCVGYDFTFGINRKGTAKDLQDFGRKYGFDVRVIEPFTVGGMTVSSTKIRSFALSGRVYAASVLLGRPLVLSGKVVRGAGRGADLGYPTANLEVEQELIPAPGVYAAWCIWDENHFPAAVNIGSVPTFRTNGNTTVEAYIMDWSGDLYDKHLELELVRRLRPEIRYNSAEELTEQIKKDVLCTRETLMKL